VGMRSWRNQWRATGILHEVRKRGAQVRFMVVTREWFLAVWVVMFVASLSVRGGRPR